MKKKISISTIFFLLMITTLSCKKEIAIINHSAVKLKTAITINSDGNDTIRYFYNDTTIKMISNFGISPSRYDSATYYKTKTGYFYYEFSGLKYGYITLNAQGYVDTTTFSKTFMGVFSTKKFYYDSNGYMFRSFSYENSSFDDIKYYYNYNKNYSYWIEEITRPLNPSTNTKDSIVFEYFPDYLFTTSLNNPLYKTLGTPEKNLVKKCIYFDLLNHAAIYRTIEYSYTLDNDGLVTQSVTKYFNQPGNVLTRADVVAYTYYK